MPIPKVVEALAVWRRYPRQIAADLSRYHHRRIADWHRGVMSSYELLELLEFMPEEGALAKAIRGGERPDWQQMLAQIANETAVLRASQVQGVDSSDYGSRLWLSLAKIREQIEQIEESEEAQEAVMAGFADRTGRRG